MKTELSKLEGCNFLANAQIPPSGGGEKMFQTEAAIAPKRNPRDDFLANVRKSCASAVKRSCEKKFQAAGTSGRNENTQREFLANARSSCASAAKGGGGEKSFKRR